MPQRARYHTAGTAIGAPAASVRTFPTVSRWPLAQWSGIWTRAILRRRAALLNGMTVVLLVAIAPPATNRFDNPGLLDGLIAAEQILRAARGVDEGRPSRRNPHGTCATGSRPQGVRAHAQTPFCDLGNRRSVQRLVTGRSAAISVAARLHFGCPQPLALTPSCWPA